MGKLFHLQVTCATAQILVGGYDILDSGEIVHSERDALLYNVVYPRKVVGNDVIGMASNAPQNEVRMGELEKLECHDSVVSLWTAEAGALLAGETLRKSSKSELTVQFVLEVLRRNLSGVPQVGQHDRPLKDGRE